MKHFFAVAVLLVAVTACVWPPVELATPATSHALPKKPAQISISTPFSSYGQVKAESGLRLRSVPDSAGPTESQTLTIMPDGSAFEIVKCEMFQSQEWAFGKYTDARGEQWSGWAAVRYLEGTCKK